MVETWLSPGVYYYFFSFPIVPFMSMKYLENENLIFKELPRPESFQYRGKFLEPLGTAALLSL